MAIRAYRNLFHQGLGKQKDILETALEEMAYVENARANVRVNLLKRGWFVSLRESHFTPKKNEVNDNGDIEIFNGKQLEWKPKNNIETLLNMLTPGENSLKTGQDRGTMDKMRESLLSKGWFVVQSNIDSAKPVVVAENRFKKVFNNSDLGETSVAKDRGVLKTVKAKRHVKLGKASKKVKRQELTFNTLLQQGLTILNRCRHQVTKVKLQTQDESQLNTSPKVDKYKNAVDTKDHKPIAPDGSGACQQKKKFLRKFLKRSRKLIESEMKED